MIVAITEQPYRVLDVRKENSRKYPNPTLLCAKEALS